jgi:uncharacterized phage-like protein YoqJ
MESVKMDCKKFEDIICCFSGHRQLTPNLARELSGDLECKILEMIQRGVTVFRSGGARGFDTLAAQLVLQMKQRYNFIKLELVLPYRRIRSSAEGAEVYAQILSQADRVRYASDVYYRGCMHVRNRMLVDGSAYCIAYLTQESGGTFYTVQYARAHGVEIFFCDAQNGMREA